MIIGLTNARMKFPNTVDLVDYLMNSDEDYDEAEFAFDWSEAEPENLENVNFDPYVDAIDLIRPSWETFGPDPDTRTWYPTSSTPASSPRLPSSPCWPTPAGLRQRIEDPDNDPQDQALAQEDLRTWRTSTQT